MLPFFFLFHSRNQIPGFNCHGWESPFEVNSVFIIGLDLVGNKCSVSFEIGGSHIYFPIRVTTAVHYHWYWDQHYQIATIALKWSPFRASSNHRAVNFGIALLYSDRSEWQSAAQVLLCMISSTIERWLLVPVLRHPEHAFRVLGPHISLWPQTINGICIDQPQLHFLANSTSTGIECSMAFMAFQAGWQFGVPAFTMIPLFISLPVKEHRASSPGKKCRRAKIRVSRSSEKWTIVADSSHDQLELNLSGVFLSSFPQKVDNPRFLDYFFAGKKRNPHIS